MSPIPFCLLLASTLAMAEPATQPPAPAALVRAEAEAARLAKAVQALQTQTAQLVAQANHTLAHPPQPGASAPAALARPTPVSTASLVPGDLLQWLGWVFLGGLLGWTVATGASHWRCRPGKVLVQQSSGHTPTPPPTPVDPEHELAGDRVIETQDTDIVCAAEAYAAAGRPELALRLLALELAENPDNVDAARLRQRLVLRQLAEQAAAAQSSEAP